MENGRQSIAFRSGIGPAVQIDAVNANGQRCCGTLGVPGTHNGAAAYKMECNLCGFVYRTNSGDVFDLADFHKVPGLITEDWAV